MQTTTLSIYIDILYMSSRLRLKAFWFSKDECTGHRKGKEKKKKTEEEVKGKY